MPFSTMIEMFVLFVHSPFRSFSLPLTSWLPEGCHSGAPRAEHSHHRTHTPVVCPQAEASTVQRVTLYSHPFLPLP